MGFFITVRHGDSEEAIVNTECMVCNLIDYIRTASQNHELEIELANESGELKGISVEENYFKPAESLFTEREILVLVRVERMGEQMHGKARYLPMLHDPNVVNASFLTNLAKHGPDSRKGKTRANKEERQRTKTPTEQVSDSQERKRSKKSKTDSKSSTKNS